MKDFTIEFIFHKETMTTPGPTVGWKFVTPDTHETYGGYVKLGSKPVGPEMIIEAINLLAVQAIRVLDMVQRGINDDTNTKI